MAGYTRQDSTNQIANGKVIDADVFDSEYNAIEGAFNATAGHSHNGDGGEGAPITVVGPAQDVIVSATQILPKTTNTLDLGSDAAQYKNAWFDGTVVTDTLAVDETATIIGATTLSSTLDVTGAATLSSTLDVTGDTTVGGTFDATGNSTVGGTLDVTGNTTVGGTLDVTGNVTFGGNLTVNGVLVAEYISDTVGNMVSSNTESGIAVTYDDTDNTLDFDVGDFTITLAGDLSGSTTITNLGNATLTAAVLDNSHNHTSSTITDFTTAARNSISVDEGLDYNSSTGVLSAELATYTNPGVAAFDSSDFSILGGLVSLAKDPVITLTGDVSGTATMTNLGNVSITVTVADDSHNHTIANVDGLQAALDGKQAAGTYNTVIGTDTDINTSGATIIDNIYVTDGVITSMGTRTLTLADLGYTGSTNADNYTSWSLYVNGSNVDTITSGEVVGFDQGNGITVSWDGSRDIIISHADTSSQSSVNNSGNTVIQDVTVDTYGHVTGLASATIDTTSGNIGHGQTWQNVSRAKDTWYQNTTGRPIQVHLNDAGGGIKMDIGPSTSSYITLDNNDYDSDLDNGAMWIVPAGHYYRSLSNFSLQWAELR